MLDWQPHRAETEDFEPHRARVEGNGLLQMVHLAAPSLTQQFEYASTRQIPVLVLLASTFGATGAVKVSYTMPALLCNASYRGAMGVMRTAVQRFCYCRGNTGQTMPWAIMRSTLVCDT